MHSTGNTVNNSVITLYGDRWLLDFYGSDHIIIRYINVKLLCGTPETNMILYIRYTLIKEIHF